MKIKAPFQKSLFCKLGLHIHSNHRGIKYCTRCFTGYPPGYKNGKVRVAILGLPNGPSLVSTLNKETSKSFIREF